MTPATLGLSTAQRAAAPVTLRLVLPYPPSINHFKAVVRGRMITTAEGRAYYAAAEMAAREARFKPFSGPVVVEVDIYRAKRAGDLDNRLKVVLDVLTGHAYHDDKQVVEIHARRFDDKENPRAVVSIRQVAQLAEVGS